MHGVGVQLQVERFTFGMEFAHGFLHGIGEGITDVFGFTHLAGRNAVFVSVCLGVGFSKTIEVTAGEAAFMPARVVLANVSGGVAVFLHRLGNGDPRSRNVLVLLWAFEFRLSLGNTRCLISVQVAHHVDPVVDPRRILAGKNGRPARRAVWLHVGVGEAEPILGELRNVRSQKFFCVRAHGRFGSTDLVPAKIVDHVDDDIRLIWLAWLIKLGF